jgi:hypothetical protein
LAERITIQNRKKQITTEPAILTSDFFERKGDVTFLIWLARPVYLICSRCARIVATNLTNGWGNRHPFGRSSSKLVESA